MLDLNPPRHHPGNVGPCDPSRAEPSRDGCRVGDSDPDRDPPGARLGPGSGPGPGLCFTVTVVMENKRLYVTGERVLSTPGVVSRAGEVLLSLSPNHIIPLPVGSSLLSHRLLLLLIKNVFTLVLFLQEEAQA